MPERTHKKRIEAEHAARGLTSEQIRRQKNQRSHQRNLARKAERRARAESLLPRKAVRP